MSLYENGIAALGKLLTVGLLAFVFLLGLGGVLFVSLQGEEVKVPEIVGKNFESSEDELASLGLRIKKRADRYSEEPPDTVLEQLPKPGETVKTGQMVLVVVSKANPEGEEKPATIQKGDEKGDSEKIEELISEKPKKKNSNANVNAAPKTGDANTAGAENKSDAGKDADSDSKKPETNSSSGRKEAKPTPTPAKPAAANTKTAKPATDARQRRVTQQ